MRHPVPSPATRRAPDNVRPPKKERDPKPWRQAVGLRLRYLRSMHQESPYDLARSLSITAPAVDQWEAGKTTPSPENMIQIARRYGVSLGFLFCYDVHQMSDDDLRFLMEHRRDLIERMPERTPLWFDRHEPTEVRRDG